MFTNIDPSLIELPASHGYIYCKLCKKFTFKENKHCSICNKCTSKVKFQINNSILARLTYKLNKKDGGVYKHCNDCKQCTKITYIHCGKCNSCHLDQECHTGIRSNKRKFEVNNNNNKKKT